jgi:hypothetical protein
MTKKEFARWMNGCRAELPETMCHTKEGRRVYLSILLRTKGYKSQEELEEKLFERCRERDFYSAVAPKDFLLTYHPSIWKCRQKGKLSPYEAWNNDEYLRKAIHNQLLCRPDDLSYMMTIQRFTAAHLAPRVTLFSASTMKKIISLVKPNNIIDPFSGYSGRLLGAYEEGIPYTGYDINEVTVRESQYMIRSVQMLREDKVHDYYSVGVRDLLQTIDNKEYDTMITCPPYGAKDMTSIQWAMEAIKRYRCRQYVFVTDMEDDRFETLGFIDREGRFTKARGKKARLQYVLRYKG